MGNVVVRAFRAPTMVLLAFDWDEAPQHADLLGFVITRTGSISGPVVLKNRLSFDGPVPDPPGEAPSTAAPIQKFMWWDAGVRSTDNESYTYSVVPVTGTPDALTLLEANAGSCDLTLPDHVEDGVGTWFNRAVVSSQAFSRQLQSMGLDPTDPNLQLTDEQQLALRTWLADGLETVVPDYLNTTDSIFGAIYHLTDEIWIIPALRASDNQIDLVFDDRPPKKGEPSPNDATVQELADKQNISFHPRTKTNIMHDKFLVRLDAQNQSESVLCGSANFTSEGLSSQANLLHTFDSPQLGDLFLKRQQLISPDPTVAATAKGADWSDSVSVGAAQVRVFFSPEPTNQSVSIDTVVQTINAATSSVLFCLFSPTDTNFLQAAFDVGDSGKMMFGLVNHIVQLKPGQTPLPADVDLFHRSRNEKDVVDAESFAQGAPVGFLPELPAFPGDNAADFAPILIHHKLIIVDGETSSPTIYSGSANISENSTHHNDEALLEIKGTPALAQLYVAEFFRLYENYRARAKFRRPASGTLALAKDARWAAKYFRAGSPEARARVAMATGVPTP
jgi:phosphatidylserine/phosphatidylglycerophosphate/cardiolipin synthase-like enzyme